MKKKFNEDDLRYWEFCKAHSLPLPDILSSELIALWKKHGFDARIVEIMRSEYLIWENRNLAI